MNYKSLKQAKCRERAKPSCGSGKEIRRGTQWDHVQMSCKVLVPVGHPSGEVEQGDLCARLEVKGEIWPGDAESRVASL